MATKKTNLACLSSIALLVIYRRNLENPCASLLQVHGTCSFGFCGLRIQPSPRVGCGVNLLQHSN